MPNRKLDLLAGLNKLVVGLLKSDRSGAIDSIGLLEQFLISDKPLPLPADVIEFLWSQFSLSHLVTGKQRPDHIMLGAKQIKRFAAFLTDSSDAEIISMLEKRT